MAALRSLKKQKVFALINIIGLAVGMAGFTLFAHMAGVKLNADKFHKNADRIYGVVQVLQNENQEDIHTAFVPAPMAGALLAEFPEIEKAVRVMPAGRMIVRHENDSFYENAALFADPDFLTVFSFKMSAGNPETALAQPNSIVLSEAAAVKYFGEEDPVGQVLTIARKINVTVTGVTKNVPRTSSLRFDFLVSIGTASSLSAKMMDDDWKLNRHATFLLLPKGWDKSRLEAKLPRFRDKFLGDSPEAAKAIYLFPFLDFRLKARHISSILGSSHPTGIIIMFSIGILLLFIVCINFINLSTSRYMHRIREIGIRKVIGARRSQLVKQFLGESLLLSFLALPLAVILYELIHPIFAAYMGDFSLITFTSQVSNSIWNYPFLIQYLLVAAILAGLFSGIYPALYLSAFQPVQVLKGSLKTGKRKRRGSKIMIVFQFTLSIIFIVAASLLKNQFGHFFNADLGYNRDRIAVLPIVGEAGSKLNILRAEISRNPDVTLITAAAGLPIVWESPQPALSPEKTEEEAVTVQAYGVDYDFAEALDIQILSGRSFSRAQGDKNGFIISETAAERLQWEDPIGQTLKVGERSGTVIAVAKDFLFADIGFSIPPAVLYLEPENLNFMLIKFSSMDRFPALEEFIKEKWQGIMPDLPLSCRTLDEYFNRFFKLVNKFSGFLNIIGITAVLFSCLGLLGLSSYLVERRTKEIGIRKILGASLGNVTWQVIREFIILVAIANVIALGLVQLGWIKVLQTGLLFITNISFATYFYAIFLSLITAVLAVTSQTWKAVRRNPVDSLRFE